MTRKNIRIWKRRSNKMIGNILKRKSRLMKRYWWTKKTCLRKRNNLRKRNSLKKRNNLKKRNSLRKRNKLRRKKRLRRNEYWKKIDKSRRRNSLKWRASLFRQWRKANKYYRKLGSKKNVIKMRKDKELNSSSKKKGTISVKIRIPRILNLRIKGTQTIIYIKLTS